MGDNNSTQLLAMFAQFLGVPKEQVNEAISSFTQAMQNAQTQEAQAAQTEEATGTVAMLHGGKFDYLVNKLKTGGKACPTCKKVSYAKKGEKNEELKPATVTAESTNTETPKKTVTKYEYHPDGDMSSAKYYSRKDVSKNGKEKSSKVEYHTGDGFGLKSKSPKDAKWVEISRRNKY